MSFDPRGKYLLAQDIQDWNEYNEDGTVKYYSKWLDKRGRVTWVDQATKEIVFVE